MNLKIINVGNGTSEYPGNFTKKEMKIIKYNSTGRILHLFSGHSTFGNTRVDYSCKEATVLNDVFEYLNQLSIRDLIIYDTVILDPPYNQTFANKYQKLGDTPDQFIIFASTKKTTELFNLISNKIKPKIIIIKSWNYYIPKNYRLKKGFLCYSGGFRKSTVLLILERIKNEILY